MSKIVTKEELKKIAALTKVSFQDHEYDEILQQFNDVLSYAQRVVEIAQFVQVAQAKNVNCNRPDLVVATSNEKILAQAPQTEDGYFVVPKFVEN